VRPSLLAGLVAGIVASVAPARAAEFVPHQAAYALTLHSSRQGAGVVAASGEMIADWSEACEGWTFDHKFALDVTYATGASTRITSNVATWESRDGREYRFTVRNLADDDVTEAFEGHASLDGPGKGGTAVFDRPDAQTFDLPKGTMFPVAHTLLILDKAGEEATTVIRPVFDGLSDEGAYEINAVIGRPMAPPSAGHPVTGKLAGKRSWPVTMAFFPVSSNDAQPEHEIALRLYENGVADEFLIRFDEFAVKAKLSALSLSNRPKCGM
jgi:hypothetical protein